MNLTFNNLPNNIQKMILPNYYYKNRKQQLTQKLLNRQLRNLSNQYRNLTLRPNTSRGAFIILRKKLSQFGNKIPKNITNNMYNRLVVTARQKYKLRR